MPLSPDIVLAIEKYAALSLPEEIDRPVEIRFCVSERPELIDRSVDSAVIALWLVKMEDIYLLRFFLSRRRISSANGPAREYN
jgi:hypothetical protein